MSLERWTWVPAAVLLAGAVLVYGTAREQLRMPLRAPLESAVPRTFGDWEGRDLEISPEEQRVAGMSSYVMRTYALAEEPNVSSASVYVAYYEQQAQGRAIHSPRNCLPGGGWEPLLFERELIPTTLGAQPVNRYLIRRGAATALVLYWYQGRDRVAADEYAVKWHLLRDRILTGRSDEALVRVVVPITGEVEEAHRLALEMAQKLIPSVAEALPT